ncbi:hypothetical protein H0H93_002113 [Arthromyces matolae]|nr:hypothetical protein H0H93_002113 [Arthromyces matolae]
MQTSTAPRDRLTLRLTLPLIEAPISRSQTTNITLLNTLFAPPASEDQSDLSEDDDSEAEGEDAKYERRDSSSSENSLSSESSSWTLSSFDSEDYEETEGPGPFILLNTIRHDNVSRVVAVRDTDNGNAPTDGRPMCLKIVPKMKEHIIFQELEAYKALFRDTGDHWAPFVMRLEASLEDHDHIFFALELMDCDLMDILQTGGLDLRQIHRKQWVAQIATGLAAIHDAGIIHRDLKPENILVDFRYNVRISDFGCSFTSRSGKPIHRRVGYCSEITGTWPYQAPEMLRNGPPFNEETYYTLHVDWWALGLLIYELEQDIEVPKPLFEDQSELWSYVDYKPIQRNGRSYAIWRVVEDDISDEASSLVLGLIRVDPALRLDYTRVRAHNYFFSSDGYSEFRYIEARGEVGQDVPSTRLERYGKRDVFSPAIYDYVPPGRINYTWLNPLGHWGTSM